ncbi:MAG: hypothetical protein J2P17_16305, partial [Mycobacterium sp.]|nr:hypothetical protein [Mycobacterium sp.]
MSPPTLARRMGRIGLTALAAIALAAGSLATSTAAHAAAPTKAAPVTKAAALKPTRRACATPTRKGQMACLTLVRTDVRAKRGI